VHHFSREVQKFSGEVQNDLRGGAYLPTPPLKILPCQKDQKVGATQRHWPGKRSVDWLTRDRAYSSHEWVNLKLTGNGFWNCLSWNWREMVLISRWLKSPARIMPQPGKRPSIVVKVCDRPDCKVCKLRDRDQNFPDFCAPSFRICASGIWISACGFN
jgi:hypothetical protein